jgi:hypothetical protein
MRPVDEVCDELLGALAALIVVPDRSGLPPGGEALIRNTD